MASRGMGRSSGAHALRERCNPPARETRGHRTPTARDTDGTGHRGQMSAEPMSGLNPDEMDGEGAAFA